MDNVGTGIVKAKTVQTLRDKLARLEKERQAVIAKARSSRKA